MAILKVLPLVVILAPAGFCRRYETIGFGSSGIVLLSGEEPNPVEKQAPIELDEDLRRAETEWRYAWAHEKPQVKAFFYQQLPKVMPQFFAVWPKLDRSTGETVEMFARRFLGQSSGYGWTLDLSPTVFCELAYEGFLSTSIEVPVSGFSPLQVMLPWNERSRHVLDWNKVHVGRKIRKFAKHYHVTADTAFDQVLLGCIRIHGEDWLFRGLRAVLRDVFDHGYLGTRDVNVSVHTFELWDKGGRLVAGDLGYAVGGVYTSMTGFRLHDTDGAGKMQMVLTAALLEKMGFLWWDLGMVMRYKEELGAHVVSREAFMRRLRQDRDRHVEFGHHRVNGKEVLDPFLRRQKVLQALPGTSFEKASPPASRRPLRPPLMVSRRQEVSSPAALLEGTLPVLHRPSAQDTETPWHSVTPQRPSGRSCSGNEGVDPRVASVVGPVGVNCGR
mmetsp:Transcript_116326/g.336023  ORF Transcript_116326/g.336023 Transcript_116326/m.336023 type:complete len:444 (-) Transcript_116326:116-1447(-)